MDRRLYRSRTNRMFLGVCGGIAEYLNLDPTIVRVMWAMLSLIPPTMPAGIIGYLVLGFIIPEVPSAP